MRVLDNAMTISSFDTLDTAKRLKGGGFNEEQAETLTGVIRDARTADLNQLATKTDLDRLEAKLLAQMEIMRRDMTIRLGGMIIAATAILLAAKLFG
jgi:hypothetical protein